MYSKRYPLSVNSETVISPSSNCSLQKPSNIGSPKQLATVLFDELKLTSGKKRSTDADTLNDLIETHPIIEKILNWRSVAKLAGTYADALPHQIAKDGRIHTTYLQTSTNTGRLSSRNPNLQNIPIKTELGEEIRKCFVAEPGNLFIGIDYSQIQLRLLADVANVAVFKETFNAGLDIHEQTARKIFNIPDDKPVALMNTTFEDDTWASGITGVEADISYETILETCMDVGRVCLTQKCAGTSDNFALCKETLAPTRQAILKREYCWTEVENCVKQATNLNAIYDYYTWMQSATFGDTPNWAIPTFDKQYKKTCDTETEP